MSRQIYQKSGLIAALIIASISLPFGILGFTREPTATDNYYDENYYNYYNQTYYLDNETEPDYSKPLETTQYYNLEQNDFILRNFTLSSNYAYWYHWNASLSFTLRLYVTRSFFYDYLIHPNGSIILTYLDRVKIFERVATDYESSDFYSPPYLSEWLFIFVVNAVSVNVNFTDEIMHI
ncbi:MAG: hypothetical protein ACFFFT_00115 [Candidatus Thorarchaeota archaeon]